MKVEPVIMRLLPFYVPLVIGLLLIVFVPRISMFIPDLLGMSSE